MAAEKAVWGIDLGQAALKAIRLRREGDKVEALDHVFIEHPRILSQPDADRTGMISEAMQKFAENRDLTQDKLVVGVPGQHTLARFCKLPPLDNKRKIPELVRYEAQQQIPFDMDEVIWDYQVFEDPEAIETQVGIFAMRREILHDHLRFLSDVGFEPAAVQSTPLALYNAMRYDGQVTDEPIVILDIGTQNTDLIVAAGDTLWTRTIPIGGNSFTDALLKTFKLSFNKAEKLKREAQKHKYARQIFQAMRPVFADLVAEIQRSIGFFTSGRRGITLKKVLAMGNAFQLPGMMKFIQQNLGMEVIRPTTFNKLNASNAANAPELMKGLLGFGVAYGLALQGLGVGTITSNLLPPEIAKQIVWRKKNVWFYGSAAALALAATGVWSRQMLDQSAVAAMRGDARQPSFAVRGDDPANPAPDPNALAIIHNGPSAATPFERAQQVIAAGQHMSSLRNQVDGQIQEDIGKAKSIAELQDQKAVWPKIMQMFHEALPQPEPELAKARAQGPEAYKEFIEANKEFERPKRKDIFIDQFVPTYSQDVISLHREMAGGVEDTQAGGGYGATEAKPGFLMRIAGRTTFQDAAGFLNETLVRNLVNAKPAGHELEGAKVYFDKVKLLGVSRVSGGGTSPQGGMGGGIATAEVGAKDPVTGESMGTDYQFQIVFIAVLGEKPEAPPQDGM